MNTVAASFSYLYRAETTAGPNGANYILLASDKEIPLGILPSAAPAEELRPHAERIRTAELMRYNPATLVLTDDRAPVEYLTRVVPANLTEF